MNTSLQVLWSGSGYKAYLEAKATDPAWAADNGVTNYKFKDGDTVALVVPTVTDFNHGRALLAGDTVGTLIRARTPRVTQPRVRKPGTYIYFANVDFEIDGVKYRGRVPHNALRRA